ncbi:MAG: tetratricopeptide repeat protein [Candidatus Solibacter sp.]|nr:tetratricopeptide repeat protein [Candidatus Solibacter sp.]
MLALSLCASLALAQQPPQNRQRDLKVERLDTLPAPTAKPLQIPVSYAVIVGISRYRNLPDKLQLQFAERDAQAIFTALISPEGGNFRVENVHMLTGDKATLAGLRREIDTWLPSVARDDDRVLIYFAGHGFMYQGKGYLAPFDIDLDRIAATGYPMDQLGSVIGGKIKAKSKILLTDACHSGAITPEDTENLNSRFGDLSKSLFSLTASRARERSFESPDLRGGHGVFTYYVVQGMEGAADSSGDGVVTADELAEYVHTQVREYTTNQQNPTSDKANFDPDMLLAYVPSKARPATAPAPKFGTLIFESNMDGVEVFVDGKTIGVLQKGMPVNAPGLSPGEHTVQGVKMGYEPDGPRQEMVYPGQESPVRIRILIPRRRNKAAADLLQEGMKYYHKGNEQDYKKAVASFERALAADPTYYQAAFYLGRTYSALFDYENAGLSYRKAIQLDPDYLEAHANYGGILLDTGDVDEAVRQLNTVLQREPAHSVALTLVAQAYRFKALYPQSIEAARKAIQINPKTAEPHLWLADSLRLSGKFAEARPVYSEYLKLSDFDSKLAGKLNYYVLGSLVGMGRKKRVAERDIWNDLHNMAWYGMCECERKSGNLDTAIAECQKALTYDAKDPFAHYTLGLAFMTKAVKSGSVAELDPALKHFQQMLDLNPDMDEASIARKNIANIQQYLKQPR